MLDSAYHVTNRSDVLCYERDDCASKRSCPRPRGSGSLDRIRKKNRRKRYLDTHPDYFESPSLELAGLPLLSGQLRFAQFR